MEKLWIKYEKKVLTELSKITRLKWKEKAINCYIVVRRGTYSAFSDPITMPIYPKIDWFIDVLIHESIHRLWTQEGNFKKSKFQTPKMDC